MFKTMTVNKSQLKCKLGQIYTGNRDYSYKYLITCYAWGEIPFLMETNIRPEIFDRMCEGKLTPADRLELSVGGIL